jgi:hypothetical protein
MKNLQIRGSVISGTTRPQDLIPRYMELARQVEPNAYMYDAVPAFAMKDEDSTWWDTDECQEILAHLEDTLDDHAPEGCYFGAHPGDGSDFGFWELEV